MLIVGYKKVIVMLLFTVMGSTQAADDLNTTRTVFSQAMAARDVESIAQLFGEEGILVKRGGSLAKGRAEIKEGFREILADKLRSSLIALGKSAGFSLVEITSMFGKDGLPELPRVSLHAKADELEPHGAEKRSAPCCRLPGTLTS